MAAVKTYNVTAKRWAHGWELHIAGVGVTQSRGLTDAERMVRDYLATDLDIDPETLQANIVISFGKAVDAEIKAARKAMRDATAALDAAAARSRSVAYKLKAEGLSGRDIAVVMDVSPQRVSQLLNG